MKYGYARVSTHQQSTDVQIKQLQEADCDLIFSETYTRRTTKRPELNRLLETLKSGDTLTVTKLDRLAGNTREVLDLVNSLFERNINVHILNIGLIDNTPTGKLIFTVLSAFAEFEVDIIKSRMQEGKEYAKMQKGYKEGRPQKYSDEKRKLALSLLKRHTYKEVEKMTGISVSTLQRINKSKNSY